MLADSCLCTLPGQSLVFEQMWGKRFLQSFSETSRVPVSGALAVWVALAGLHCVQHQGWEMATTSVNWPHFCMQCRDLERGK